MDKRILRQAFLAFLIGFAVMFAEAEVAGLQAYYYLRGPGLHDLEGLASYIQELAISVLWLWGVASLLGAWALALLKPRRWTLYSACAVMPGAIEALWAASDAAQYGVPVGYTLLSAAVRLALVPIFLVLAYATIRRHAGAAQA